VPELFLAAAAAAAGIVWMAFAVGWSGEDRPELRRRRTQLLASAIVGVVTLGTIASQWLTSRPDRLGFVGDDGVIAGTQSHAAVLIAQATAILALALAVTLLLASRVSTRSGLLVAGALGLTVAISSLLGSEGMFVRSAFYLPIVLLGLSAATLTQERIMSLVRWACRAFVYGSLIAAVVRPSWAFHAAPGGITLLGRTDRLFGVGFHPNYLGFTAVLAVIVETSRPRSRFWVGHVAAALVVVALAGSRTAWVALAAVVLIAALAYARRRSVGVTVCAACGLVLIPLYLAISTHGATVANLDNRTSIWDQTLSIWRTAPIFGVGPGLYRGTGSGTGSIVVDQAHNQALQSLAEGGIVGVALFALVVLVLFRAALRDWRLGSFASMAALGAFACLMFSESPLCVTGASHAMLVDIAVFLVVLRRPLSRVAATASEPDHAQLRPVAA